MSYYSYQVALFKSPTAEFALPEAQTAPDEQAVLLTARLSARQFVAIAARAGKDSPDPLEGLIARPEGAFRVGKSRVHGSIRDLGRCISEADAAFRAEKAPARATDSLYLPHRARAARADRRHARRPVPGREPAADRYSRLQPRRRAPGTKRGKPTCTAVCA